MNTEILILKGTISELPEKHREAVKKCCDQILDIVRASEEAIPGVGFLAIALAGMTLQEEMK